MVGKHGGELSGVSSTLLIPLAARALGDALFPQVAVGDVYAATILAALGDDGSRWIKDRHGIYGCLARIRRFRQLAGNFLDQSPAACVVNLGCGLSYYFQWLDNGFGHMIDADLPAVLALRRRLLPIKNKRHALCPVDLCREDWWDQLGLPADRTGEPVFLFSEGVMMYLPPAIVERVLRTVSERAPAGSILAFDAFCSLIVGQAWLHPSVSHTAAEFLWGPRSLAELHHPYPRLRLQAAHPVMESFGLPYMWAWPMFQAMMGVPMYAVYALKVTDEPQEQ